MFKPVSPRVDLVKMEEKVLAFWKERQIFQRSMQEREGGPEYVFYEGPPTANGRPGIHHVLARAFKDMFPRYKTMRGYHVLRRGGWDTHGLPVEIEVEKKLGFTNKQQIEAYGIDRFNALCRESVFSYIQDWERLTERIAYWVDLETAYVTYHNEYIESLWWILKKFWEKDLLYKGFKVVPYCPRCGTPLSDHEVSLGYQETEDPSIFVRMRLEDEPDVALLVWTTTPWTLPANVAVAVHPEVDYVRVRRQRADGETEVLILAQPLLDKVFGEEPVEVLAHFKGSELLGTRYQPLFRFLEPDKPAHFVVAGDFVTTEDGTGLVHIAPAFGADDMEMARRYDLPVLQTVKPDGTFIEAVQPWQGVFVKEADPQITADLEARGLLFREQKYAHTYPFCWRCKTPLLYYARSSWFIRTSTYRDQLVALNQRINWVPEHIKDGRFGNWLENNIDWALSRERYWGTPLPVWECDACGHREAIGSRDELSQKTGQDLSELDLHRPYVDEVRWACEKCEGTMRRVPDLIDVWFDSGAMPVAQWHYPFAHQDEFKKQHPADFICEAVDQTRGWFYSLHAISTLLFEREAYKNVICLGLILDEDGHKMSKSRGNIVDPWDVIEQTGSDAIRWYFYTAGPPGQERRFSPNLVKEVVRSFVLTLWNVYSFFVTYANLDGWTPASTVEPQYTHLDKWLHSELHTLVRQVTEAYEQYDVPNATRPIERFVENLSTWYVRLSRRRFWKTGDAEDKEAAYRTLYEALTTVARLLAPAMPFLADELYQNLVRSVAPDAPESVHLALWPEYDAAWIDETLNRDMALVMKLVSLGHAARQKANRKVRQPLSEVAFAVGRADERQAVLAYQDLIAAELNVKQVRLLAASGEAVSYRLKPLPRQLGQKYGRRFPAIRQALLALDAAEAAARLLNGQPVTVTVDGETLDILPDEVDVIVEAQEGYAVAADGPYMAALVTTLTPELQAEGWAREAVRYIQDLRKKSGLDVADHIHLWLNAAPELAAALQTHVAYIANETLADEVQFAPPAAAAKSQEVRFDDLTLQIGIRKV